MELRKSVVRALKRKVELISTRIIKPAFPTHSSLKHYNYSPVDQFSPKNYIPIVFYYPNNKLMFSGRQHLQVDDDDIIANRLRRSLSETLVQYYPFSGRLNSLTHLHCNDDGVEFEQVNIDCHMDEAVEQESLGPIFPDGGIWGSVNQNSPLLAVRLANYICGGISVAVCLSHKLGDAKSFQTFMTSWATKTRRHLNSTNSNEDVPPAPHFIFHPRSTAHVPEFQPSKKDWAARSFLFPKLKISKLKQLVSQKSGLEKISGFEVVTALLCKCAATANTATSGLFTTSTLFYSMNMRDTVVPRLPETSIGNFYWFINIAINNEKETGVSTLVEKMRKGKLGMGGVKTLDAALVLSKLEEYQFRENDDSYYCSSLCKMQFYRIDFGWGNPSRVAVADAMMNNSFTLMDTPNGDGIEALVTLTEKSMAAFQQEKDILEFTSSYYSST